MTEIYDPIFFLFSDLSLVSSNSLCSWKHTLPIIIQYWGRSAIEVVAIII